MDSLESIHASGSDRSAESNPRGSAREQRAVQQPAGRPARGWFSSEESASLAGTRIRLRRGGRLYRTGDRFESLFIVRFGFLKATAGTDDGREQIIGFHLAGDVVGLDGIAVQQYSCEVTALESAELIVVPYCALRGSSPEAIRLRQRVHCAMSRELIREQNAMLLLGRMNAEQRVAAFLLDLAQRFRLRGYSRSEFILRMTRAEIGSYLGVTLETISRCLSRFAREGLIACSGRQIRILEPEALGQRTGSPGDADGVDERMACSAS